MEDHSAWKSFKCCGICRRWLTCRKTASRTPTLSNRCVIRYLAGESPTKIFREAGLPPELIGYKRIERSVARWKAAVLKSVNGSSNMSNGEIITELVNLYVHAVTRKEKLDDIAGIANPDKANIENAPNSLDGANVSGGGVYPLTCPSHPMRLPSPCRLHLSARAAALTARRRLSSSNNRLGASTSWNAKTNRSVAS